jgi:hypothetical protein
MTQLTELKQEATRRNRSRSLTNAVVVLVLVLVVAWTAADKPWRSGNDVTPGRPTPSTSPATPAPLTQAQTVGANLHEKLQATAAAGWTVNCDCDFVWLSNPNAGVLFIAGPITQIWDPVKHRAAAPPADYAHWLRTHPWLTVLSESTARAAGQVVPILRMHVRPNATMDVGGQLAKVDLVGQPWDTVTVGDTFTEVVLHVGGRTMLVRAFGADTPQMQNALQTALLNLLQSLRP